jgi:hypothetical protein
MVLAAGDVLGEQLAQAGVAKLVEIGNAEALAAALQELLQPDDLRASYAPRFEQLIAELRWDKVAEPLVRFCTEPRKAPDHVLRSRTGARGRVRA